MITNNEIKVHIKRNFEYGSNEYMEEEGYVHMIIKKEDKRVLCIYYARLWHLVALDFVAKLNMLVLNLAGILNKQMLNVRGMVIDMHNFQGGTFLFKPLSGCML